MIPKDLALSQTAKASWKTFLEYLILYLVSFFAIYFPIIVFTVLTGDDFNYYFHWNSAEIIAKCPTCFTLGTDHWLTDSFQLFGRPLANPLHCLALRAIRDLSHYPAMRSLSVFLAALIASLFAFRLYSRCHVEKRLAFLTGFVVFTLPGMMFYITYYSFSLSWFVSLLLTIAAVELTERIQNLWPAVISIGLVIISLLIYQPTAVFFVTYTALLLIFSPRENWPKTRQWVLRNLSVFVLAIGAYFILCKFWLLPYFAAKHPVSAQGVTSSDYQFSLGTNIPQKIAHLKNISFVGLNFAGLNVDSLFHKARIAFWLVGLMIAGVAANLVYEGMSVIRDKRSILASIRFYIQISTFIVILCLLANTQNMSHGNQITSRQIFPYAALLALFLVFALMQIARLFRKNAHSIVLGSMMLLAVALGFFTYDRVLRWITINHYLENRFVQYQLAQQIKNGQLSQKEVNYIHVVMPAWGRSFLGLPFGMVDEIYSASARVDKIPGLVHFNLVQLGFDLDQIYIPDEDYYGFGASKNQIKFDVTRGYGNKYNDKMVINMNDLLPPIKKINIQDFSTFPLSNDQIIKVTESSYGTGHTGRGAFDGSTDPDDFWEAEGCPQWLQIMYAEKRKITRYLLQSGFFAAERMPKAWKLQGSNDGINWEDLDERTNQTAWKTDETRTYVIAKPNAYSFYRFYFTAGNETSIIRVYEIKMVP